MESSASDHSLIMDKSDSLSNLDVTWSSSTPNLRPSRPDSARRRSASFMAVQAAVLQLTRINDFVMEKISEGFFAEVYKVINQCGRGNRSLKQPYFKVEFCSMQCGFEIMASLPPPVASPLLPWFEA